MPYIFQCKHHYTKLLFSLEYLFYIFGYFLGLYVIVKPVLYSYA
jgi:hypothetical protein